MKKIKVLLLLSVVLPTLTSAGITIDGANGDKAASGTVYICMSSGAKRFHDNRDCHGLNRCEARIKAVSITVAEERGLTPCKICYHE